MKDLDHALTLIEAVVSAVDLPVTLKTWLGWDDNLLNAADLARRAEDAGVKMITIHGRTRCQFYKGSADWAAIRSVKEAVGIPVIANGDIMDTATARQALKLSGADGVMIGRGVQGRPWLLAQVAAEIHGTPSPTVPTGPDFADLVAAHYDTILSFYGKELGARVARKHLSWYMDEAGTDADLRKSVLTERDPNTVFARLEPAFSHQSLAA